MNDPDNAAFARRQLQALLSDGGSNPAVLADDRWWTWSELGDVASAIEATLLECAVPERTPVVLVPRNRPSALAALFGLMAQGRVPLLVSPIQPAVAIASAIDALAPAAVVIDRGDLAEEVRIAIENVRAVVVTIGDGDGTVGGACGEAVGVAGSKLADSETALIVPTSGTTGAPKPIPILWSQLPFDGAKGLRLPRENDPRPPLIHALSMATITGAMGALGAAARGRKLAMLERVDVDEWSQLVERFQLRRAGLPPAAMRTMLDRSIPPERLASLDAWHTGSAPLTPEFQREFEATYGVPVLVAYGATEFGGAVASWTLGMHATWSATKIGAVGRPVDGVELRILDEETRQPLPPDQPGLLSVRVPRVSDRWLDTNDRARIDEDGFLFILGRADNVIVRGGFKVSLDELEALLREHPEVLDVAAVGVPDHRLGQVPGVAVVLTASSGITPEELRAWVRERTAPYKVPTSIVMFDALPTNASHKTDRAELRRRLAGSVAPTPEVPS